LDYFFKNTSAGLKKGSLPGKNKAFFNRFFPGQAGGLFFILGDGKKTSTSANSG
jgi:hypothetical protein